MSAALQCDNDNDTDPGPCTCEWCMRYGNPDVFVNTRPIIRHGAYVLEIPGRCTRCHYALGDHAYMVREKTWVDDVRYPDDSVIVVYNSRLVPVCDVCVTDDELDHVKQKVTCRGCGRCLSVPGWRTSRVNRLMGVGRAVRAECNNACFRRALRKKRRVKDLTCTVCKEEFTSARKDAKYCSGACRQWAYRLREFAA
jgi:hypothetical protein